MCPNCFPATSNIAVGYWMALTICALFFVVAVGVMLFASRSGRLDNLEETKFRMLED